MMSNWWEGGGGVSGDCELFGVVVGDIEFNQFLIYFS